MAVTSKAWVCGCVPVRIVSSNPARVTDVRVLWMLCVVRLGALRWADHSSRGVLPSAVCPMSVIMRPNKDRP